jgi:5-methylcytosine-specific restriction endonuclease McrA
MKLSKSQKAVERIRATIDLGNLTLERSIGYSFHSLFLFGDWHMEKLKRYCNSCGEKVETIETLKEEGPHYSFHTCVACGRHLGFGKKPENESKRPKNNFTAEDLKISFCQMCLRPKDRLGSRGVLEVHHVIEIQANGPDIPENIWVVCTSCHRLIHHQRKYLNEHLSNCYNLASLQADMDRHNVPLETQEIMKRIFIKGEEDNARDNT